MSRLRVLSLVLGLLLISLLSWYLLEQYLGPDAIAVQPEDEGDGNDDYPNATWAGDGIVQSPNSEGVMEECEIGVNCLNPNEVCNLTTYMCDPQDQPPPSEDGEQPPGGDGETPPDGDGEMHMECIGESCVQMDGPGSDECIINDDCAEEEGEMHMECMGGVCIEMDGPGSDECIINDDCEEKEIGEGMHTICLRGGCMAVEGEGPNECTYDSQCRHYGCVGGALCQILLTPGNDECSNDYDCIEGSHTECSGGRCIDVEGGGRDQCIVDADCVNPTHRACILDDCVELEGEGPDECYVNDDCGLFHTECQDEECVLVEGKGDNECMVDDDCVEVEPPNLDCGSICAQIPGADFLAQGLSSSTACKNALPDFYPSTTCYTTCRYPWFNRVDNIAGYDSCCCGVVKRFPCEDCPGQNPACPNPDDICAANEPSWYSP